jgi:hypothetical protein
VVHHEARWCAWLAQDVKAVPHMEQGVGVALTLAQDDAAASLTF